MHQTGRSLKTSCNEHRGAFIQDKWIKIMQNIFIPEKNIFLMNNSKVLHIEKKSTESIQFNRLQYSRLLLNNQLDLLS